MQFEEQRLIDRLFQRLKQTEHNAEPRDAEAEQKIQGFIQQQPAAPYYMAQSLLIQEAALNRLNQQVQQLQNNVAQLKATQQPVNRSFLGKLFNSNRSNSLPQLPAKTLPLSHTSSASSTGTSCDNSFMSGALKTAAGVAGGVVLGNILTNMFHHAAPQEIISTIDNPAALYTGENDALLNQNFDTNNLETFNSVSDKHFLDQNDTLSNNECDTNDFSNDDDGFF
ncbi:DUF2076 domain-containing protein [Candidatus Fukatsuia anoeciicola]|uniref:DUF2076 domain-containing protein n=1 Tax=Candidatus Fukatsuia anoeciicola TaxID=2994492 RepID=UPI00346440A9